MLKSSKSGITTGVTTAFAMTLLFISLATVGGLVAIVVVVVVVVVAAVVVAVEIVELDGVTAVRFAQWS